MPAMYYETKRNMDGVWLHESCSLIIFPQNANMSDMLDYQPFQLKEERYSEKKMEQRSRKSNRDLA